MLVQIIEECNIDVNEKASVYIGKDTRYKSLIKDPQPIDFK